MVCQRELISNLDLRHVTLQTSLAVRFYRANGRWNWFVCAMALDATRHVIPCVGSCRLMRVMAGEAIETRESPGVSRILVGAKTRTEGDPDRREPDQHLILRL
jgi:hypothetical protein